MMLLLLEAARCVRHLLKLEQPLSLEAACSSGVQQYMRPSSHCSWCRCLQSKAEKEEAKLKQARKQVCGSGSPGPHPFLGARCW
jgi:hypothetical protein